MASRNAKDILIKRPVDLESINGKPTGQGFYGARKGPQVKGKPLERVVDEEYPQGTSFSTKLKEVPNCGVK